MKLYKLITETRLKALRAKSDHPLHARLWAEYRLLDAVATLIDDPPSTDAISQAAVAVSMHTN